MKSNSLSTPKIAERALLALLFVAIGSTIYVVFSPLRPYFDSTTLERITDYLGRIGLIATLLGIFGFVRRSERFGRYAPVFLGLLIMAIAVSADRIFGVYLLEYLDVNGKTPNGFALLKLNECLIVASVVVLLTRSSGGTLGSIYIQKGNLKRGLAIGLISFGLAAAGSTLMATSLFKGQNLTFERIMVWLPWLLIFVLANASQEELLFRGLFLRKLEPFFGRLLSNSLVALVFTTLHYGADYASSNTIFVIAVTLLAVAWGAIMQKTDNIWGSILFHAGMDIPIMLGIFSNL